MDIERFTCTAVNPWNPNQSSRIKKVEHPDAYEGYSDAEYTTYECPHCGHSWRVYWDECR